MKKTLLLLILITIHPQEASSPLGTFNFMCSKNFYDHYEYPRETVFKNWRYHLKYSWRTSSPE